MALSTFSGMATAPLEIPCRATGEPGGVHTGDSLDPLHKHTHSGQMTAPSPAAELGSPSPMEGAEEGSECTVGAPPLGSSTGLVNLGRSSLLPILGPTVWTTSVAPAPEPQPVEAFPFCGHLPGNSLARQPLPQAVLLPPLAEARRSGEAGGGRPRIRTAVIN